MHIEDTDFLPNDFVRGVNRHQCYKIVEGQAANKVFEVIQYPLIKTGELPEWGENDTMLNLSVKIKSQN